MMGRVTVFIPFKREPGWVKAGKGRAANMAPELLAPKGILRRQRARPIQRADGVSRPALRPS